VGNSIPHELSEFPPRSSGTAGGVNPVVTRVDTDPHQQDAWRNESSVRAVAADGTFHPPNLPYSTQQKTEAQKATAAVRRGTAVALLVVAGSRE
jgi:hypothetical protein